MPSQRTLTGQLRFCMAILALGLATPALCQQRPGADPPRPSTPTPQGQVAGTGAADRDVSWRSLPANLVADQKRIWFFPRQLGKGKYWIPSVAIVGVTSALIATDAHSAPYFRNTKSFSGFDRVTSDTHTGAFLAAVPAAIYTVGLIKRDSYAQTTALLALEAFADGFALDLAFKGITGRKPPLQYTGSGPYPDSFFNGTHNPLHSGGFYSVHAMAATSIAAVIAGRYRHHRWVPYLAYGLAGAICFSRVTSSKHFPSDVVLGGAMGFVIARYAVLPAR